MVGKIRNHIVFYRCKISPSKDSVFFHAYKTLLNLSQPIGPFAMPTTHTSRS